MRASPRINSDGPLALSVNENGTEDYRLLDSGGRYQSRSSDCERWKGTTVNQRPEFGQTPHWELADD